MIWIGYIFGRISGLIIFIFMAEESTNWLVTHGKDELDIKNVGKNSDGNSGSLNNVPNRNIRASIGSNEKPDSAKANQTKVPHYLRASTGSCHDMCKYGGKHDFGEKARIPLRKRIAKFSRKEVKSVEIRESSGQKKEKVVNNKPYTESKRNSPDTKPSRDTKKISPMRAAASGNKIRLGKSRKNFSPEPPEVIKREIFVPSEQVEVPLKQHSSTDYDISRIEKNKDLVSKKECLVNTKPAKVKSSSSSDISNEKGKKIMKELSSTASAKAKKARNLKLASPVKDQTATRGTKTENSISSKEKISEKTLHVIKIEKKNIPSKSHANSSSSSFQEEDMNGLIRKAKPAKENLLKAPKNRKIPVTEIRNIAKKENLNKTLKKSKSVVSEDKYRSPVKLKFRIGKVLDPQSDNNNSPRRLRFRRARILGTPDVKADMRKKIFKSAGGNANTTGGEISAEKVVLKHQDVLKKKDGQGLYNNVIEKTASRLAAESRKSKVKALVGAFETVISLQDGKPSSRTVN